MKPEECCLKAKKLLESKFRQEHKIAMAYVDKVTNRPVIKAEDSEALEGFAILLSSGTNTFKTIGYSSKFESPDSMLKIIERLSPKLQSSWRNNADHNINTEEREVCISDSSLFVEQKFKQVTCPTLSSVSFLVWKRRRRIARKGARNGRMRNLVNS